MERSRSLTSDLGRQFSPGLLASGQLLHTPMSRNRIDNGKPTAMSVGLGSAGERRCAVSIVGHREAQDPTSHAKADIDSICTGGDGVRNEFADDQSSVKLQDGRRRARRRKSATAELTRATRCPVVGRVGALRVPKGVYAIRRISHVRVVPGTASF